MWVWGREAGNSDKERVNEQTFTVGSWDPNIRGASERLFCGGATFVSEYYLEFYRQIWGWWKGARRSRKSSISCSVKSNNTACSLVLASGSTSWIIYYSLMRHWRLQFSKVSWSKLVFKRSYKRTTCFHIVVSKVSGIICQLMYSEIRGRLGTERVPHWENEAANVSTERFAVSAFHHSPGERSFPNVCPALSPLT